MIWRCLFIILWFDLIWKCLFIMRDTSPIINKHLQIKSMKADITFFVIFFKENNPKKCNTSTHDVHTCSRTQMTSRCLWRHSGVYATLLCSKGGRVARGVDLNLGAPVCVFIEAVKWVIGVYYPPWWSGMMLLNGGRLATFAQQYPRPYNLLNKATTMTLIWSMVLGQYRCTSSRFKPLHKRLKPV